MKTQLKLLMLIFSELIARALRRTESNYRVEKLALNAPKPNSTISTKTLAVVHLYYLDQVEELLIRMSRVPSLSAVFVTTPSIEVQNSAEEFSLLFECPFQVVLLPNRGRNFGPLFEVMSKERQNFDYLLHVHGKKSLHSRRSRMALWAEALYADLLDPQNFSEILEFMKSDLSVAIAYPNVSKYISKINMCWGLNYDSVSDKASKLGVDKPQFLTTKLNFPAGGMFLLRLPVYQDLFANLVSQCDFSHEIGSVDGDLEHGLERIFGAIADARGMSQLVTNFDTGHHVKLSIRGQGEQLARN
jgi:lipopolysaccharide biosynthesis protein